MPQDDTRPRVSDEQMAEYRQTARRRLEADKHAREVRRVRAWDVAREGAALLKQSYGVERVVVFGSLLDPEQFSERSDVDVAAWGLTSSNWLKAMLAVQYLVPDIEINLVDVGVCSPALLAVIERDGVDL